MMHGNSDRISELLDTILLHIMNFMETKDAVKTCVLSKRWKNLCKRLVKLTFSPNPFELRLIGMDESFKKFASWILSSRDDSCSLFNLTIRFPYLIEPKLLHKVIKYALFHNVQHLSLNISFIPKIVPLIFFSQSLTYLNLGNGSAFSDIILPKFLHLPALKTLHIEYVKFIAIDSDCAEPFSNLGVLNTLILKGCSLHNDAQVLCISNSTLSTLTILGQVYQIVLSTPNLGSFTFYEGTVSHQLFSTCNLSCLGEVYIAMNLGGDWDGKSSILMKWLHVLASVKVLILSPHTCQIILRELSNPISVRPQPPSFVRLESLEVNKSLFATSDEELNTLVGYLLQNSPMDRVDIISD